MKCSGSDPTFVIEPSDFVTIAMLIALEGLLSADNAMVLAVLVLGLPKGRQRKALRYGMAGAFVFRSIATLLAKYLIQLGFVKLLGGGYLLYLVYRHFGGGKGAAIGGLAGGKKGAAIGALVGGGGGYVYDRKSQKKPVVPK